MIRCIHLWTGDDQQSHFEEGHIALDPGQRGDLLTGKLARPPSPFRRRNRAAHTHGTPHRRANSSSH